MIIRTDEGSGEVKLTDEQMSAIMSGLAVATVHWNELADPEVTTTKEKLIETSHYLLTAYAKSVGISKKEVAEAIDEAMNNLNERQQKNDISNC